MSVAVVSIAEMLLVLVQTGSKVNSSYYCDVVLNDGLLLDIWKLSDNNFIFQQDDAPAHCSRHAVVFLHLLSNQKIGCQIAHVKL